jgi:hypothetical protein
MLTEFQDFLGIFHSWTGKTPIAVRGKFCTLPILDFFFFQLEKVFRDLKRYKNPGLGMKYPTPTPQSWKLSEIPEISWKFSEIPEISWKFSESPKIAWTSAKDLYSGPLSNRFMKIVNHTTNLYYFLRTGFS